MLSGKAWKVNAQRFQCRARSVPSPLCQAKKYEGEEVGGGKCNTQITPFFHNAETQKAMGG